MRTVRRLEVRCLLQTDTVCCSGLCSVSDHKVHEQRDFLQFSESMIKVSKFGFSSDTRASTKSSTVGRLCSIPVTQQTQQTQTEVINNLVFVSEI